MEEELEKLEEEVAAGDDTKCTDHEYYNNYSDNYDYYCYDSIGPHVLGGASWLTTHQI